MKGEL